MRNDRKKLIKEIEASRGSKVIVYVTSDRDGLSAAIAPDVIPLMHEHLLAIPSDQRAKLDLVIYSRGGDADVPWTLVSMFREYCGNDGSFSVLIPYKAHSAATVISLGADEIVMTKMGELGPIDITIASGPYNPRDGQSQMPLPLSVEDVTGYFGLLERIGCDRSEEKMNGFTALTDQVHPVLLGNVHRLLEQTELVALRLLETRKNAFSEEENRAIVKQLSAKIYSHRHAIHRTEAVKRLGLHHVKNAEDYGIDEVLWELYTVYRDMFSFDGPFRPNEHLIVQEVEQNVWNDLPLASIESMARLDVCRKSTRVRRLRNVPPQVNLNVTLGSLKLPELPAGLDPNQVQQALLTYITQSLQPIIESAAKSAVGQLLATLPANNFERSDFNGGWREET